MIQLERRYCTAEEPIPEADKDKYLWGHGDAKEVGPFFNLTLYECPNCKLSFTAVKQPTV